MFSSFVALTFFLAGLSISLLNVTSAYSFWSGVSLCLTSTCLFLSDRYGWLCFDREHKTRVYFVRTIFYFISLLFFCSSVSYFTLFFLGLIPLLPPVCLFLASIVSLYTIRSSRYKPPPSKVTTNVLNPLAHSPGSLAFASRSLRSGTSHRPLSIVNTTALIFPQSSRKAFFRLRDAMAPWFFAFILFITIIFMIGLFLSSIFLLFHPPTCILKYLPEKLPIKTLDNRTVGSLYCNSQLSNNNIIIIHPPESAPHEALPFISKLNPNNNVTVCVLDADTSNGILVSLSTVLSDLTRNYQLFSIGSGSLYASFATAALGFDSFIFEPLSPFESHDSLLEFIGTVFNSEFRFKFPNLYPLIHCLFPFLSPIKFDRFYDGPEFSDHEGCITSGILEPSRLLKANVLLKDLIIQRYLSQLSLLNVQCDHGNLIHWIGKGKGMVGLQDKVPEHMVLFSKDVTFKNLEEIFY
ncbi:hypothetical protein RCL1_001388 [Eukaryota sp. TZLM3-RCL]